MAKKKKARKGRRGPKTAAGKKRSTAAYVKLLKKAHARFQPGGKAYKALKSHGAL